MPFFSLTDKDFSDLFYDPKSPLPSADDLNRLLSNVPNHFDHDLDDADNVFLTDNQLDSYLTIQEVHKLLSGKNEECSFSTMCVNVRSLTNPHNFFFFFFLFQTTLLQLGIFVVVKYMHHRDDLVEHRTREASFGAQYTNHSANSMCKSSQFY